MHRKRLHYFQAGILGLHLGFLCLRISFQAAQQCLVRGGQDLCRKKARIGASVDGHGCHRDAGGHLYDGVQGISSAKGCGMHRDTDDRHREDCRAHTGKMGCHSRTCDDHLEAFYNTYFCHCDSPFLLWFVIDYFSSARFSSSVPGRTNFPLLMMTIFDPSARTPYSSPSSS